jgi:hypothetical protein
MLELLRESCTNYNPKQNQPRKNYNKKLFSKGFVISVSFDGESLCTEKDKSLGKKPHFMIRRRHDLLHSFLNISLSVVQSRNDRC